MSKPTAVIIGVGAEQGLGAAVARRFAKGGYHVLVAGRTPAKIEQVVRTIDTAGGSAEAVTIDATREDDVIACSIERWHLATAVDQPMSWSSTPATISASISAS